MRSILAQIPDVPRLPGPPALEHYLLESPWLVAIFAAGLGLALGWTLSRSARGRLGLIVALVGVALAGGVVILAGAVETEREQMTARTRELIEAGFAADGKGFESLLASDLSVRILGQRSSRTRQQIVDEVAAGVAKRYNVEAHEIGDIRAVSDSAGVGRTQVAVRVKVQGIDLPTVWLITWRRPQGASWRASSVEAQQIGLSTGGSAGW